MQGFFCYRWKGSHCQPSSLVAASTTMIPNVILIRPNISPSPSPLAAPGLHTRRGFKHWSLPGMEVQYSAVQCSAVQCSAVQCSAVQCSAVQWSALQRSEVQYSSVQCSALQCSWVQYNAAALRSVAENSQIEDSTCFRPPSNTAILGDQLLGFRIYIKDVRCSPGRQVGYYSAREIYLSCNLFEYVFYVVFFFFLKTDGALKWVDNNLNWFYLSEKKLWSGDHWVKR